MTATGVVYRADGSLSTAPAAVMVVREGCSSTTHTSYACSTTTMRKTAFTLSRSSCGVGSFATTFWTR